MAIKTKKANEKKPITALNFARMSDREFKKMYEELNIQTKRAFTKQILAPVVLTPVDLALIKLIIYRTDELRLMDYSVKNTYSMIVRETKELIKMAYQNNKTFGDVVCAITKAKFK